MAKAYSMDLRVRVIADCGAGLGTTAMAAKYQVSPAWVRRSSNTDVNATTSSRGAAVGRVVARSTGTGWPNWYVNSRTRRWWSCGIGWVLT